MQETQQSSDVSPLTAQGSSEAEEERLRNKQIPLMECFGPTVQGEGAVIGQLTYFLRLGGCDYRCAMCDSMHAVDPVLVKANAQWLTQSQIFTALVNQRIEGSTYWVTLSGGNPCIHDLDYLCSILVTNQWSIAV